MYRQSGRSCSPCGRYLHPQDTYFDVDGIRCYRCWLAGQSGRHRALAAGGTPLAMLVAAAVALWRRLRPAQPKP